MQPRIVETIIRRCIALDCPHWTSDQIARALQDALNGRGPYALIVVDLLAGFD